MTLPDELVRRLRAFILVFAGQCKGCVRKNEYNCANCGVVNHARGLLLDLDHVDGIREEHYFVEDKIGERQYRIMMAIQEAGRPVLSHEILLNGVSRPLRIYTLKKMCASGFLRAAKNKSGRYVFSLASGGKLRLAELNNRILSKA